MTSEEIPNVLKGSRRSHGGFALRYVAVLSRLYIRCNMSLKLVIFIDIVEHGTFRERSHMAT